MSEKTNEIDKGWNGAYSNWDIPKAVDSNTLISSKASNDQVTVLLSRDMYLIDQIEGVESDLTKTTDSLGNRVTALEKSTTDLANAFNDVLSAVDSNGDEIVAIREELEKAINDLRSEMQSADAELKENIESAVSTLQTCVDTLRTDMEEADASLKSDLDAASDALRTEFEEADVSLRTEFEEADASLKTEFEEANTNIWNAINELSTPISEEKIDELFDEVFDDD